jgi:hypothetical protein
MRVSTLCVARLATIPLALSLCVLDGGCAKLRSFRSVGIAPALLGGGRQQNVATAGTDVYANRATQSLALGNPKRGAQPTIVADLAAPPGTIVRSTAAPEGAFARNEPLNIVPPISVDVSPIDALPPLDLSEIENKLRPPAAKVDPIAEARRLIGLARDRVNSAPTYQVKMNRQERVGNNLLPAEDVLLSIRREPRSVRLEWVDGPHKGREVIYNENAGGMMHIRTPNNALVPRMTLPPDSPLVARSSRHPITEAGFIPVLEKLDEAITAQADGTLRDRFTVQGPKPLPATGRPAREIVRVTAEGETWNVWFDEETHLPALVDAHDRNGDLLEHYLFSDPRLNPEELNLANAFDPDSRWGAGRGLLGRMARGVGGGENATPVEGADSTTR